MQGLVKLGMACSVVGGLACSLASGAPSTDRANRGWPYFGNDPKATRYSSLGQIHQGNVRDLRVAWTYRTGDSDGERPLQCTPIVVDGVMYVSTVQAEIAALDPATGQEKWRFR